MPGLSVLGMGYVGLPLTIAFDEAGYDVVGFDTDSRRIQALRQGTDPTGEVGGETIDRSTVRYTDELPEIEDSEYYVIAVPTPLTDSSRPDLSFVEAAGEMIGSRLTEDSTVVLESTVYPGTTRDVLIPALERESGQCAGRDFYVGYSPERTVPGDPDKTLESIVKVVSGHGETATQKLRDLYGDIVDAGIYLAETLETAEAAKCLENTQRDVNIALMNEFAMGCHQSELPVEAHDVIDAASTKWNFHEYRPGLVGGHCVPVDPKHLIWAFENQGFTPEMMRSARRTNDAVAGHVVELILEAQSQRARDFRRETKVGQKTPEQLAMNGGEMNPRLIVLGLAYKRNTNDLRAPVLRSLVEELRGEDIDIVGFDPNVADDRIQERFELPVLEELSVEGADMLLVATAHDQFRALELDTIQEGMNERPILVDLTGTYDPNEVVSHGFIYRGL